MREALPEQWSRVALGQLFDMQLGKMLSKEASMGSHQAPYLANRHVQWDRVVLHDLDTMSFNPGEREKFDLRVGDLLVCEGGEVGRTAMWHGEAAGVFFQKAIHRLRPRDARIEPGYMLRFMRRAAGTGAFTDLASQTSIAHLTQEKLALLTIPTPPLPEQRQIAAILDNVDDSIRKTEQIIAKLKRVKQGLLHDLLTRGIDDNGELRDPDRHPEQFEDSVLGRIPRTWQVDRLESLTSRRIVDGVHHTPTYVQHGVPFLTVENLSRGPGISIEPCRYVSRGAHSEYYRRADPRAGDVLVSKDGTLGIARIIPDDFPEVSIFVSIALLRPRRDRVLPELICEFFETASYMRQLAHQSAGTGLKHIHLEHFRAFVLPVPPLGEQRRIFAILGAAENRLAAERAALSALSATKHGLMEDLLTGRVRVTPLLSDAP